MDFGTVTLDRARTLIQQLRKGKLRTHTGESASVVRIYGSPLSGKSTLAQNLMLDPAYSDEVRHGSAILICSHRTSADQMSEYLAQKLGSLQAQRPVKTLPALAFRLLRDARLSSGLSQPKLVNGAEQDAAITHILQTHCQHLRNGDECPTCELLRHYVAVRQAQNAEQHPERSTDQQGAQEPVRRATQGSAQQATQQTSQQADQPVQSTADAVEALITPAFINELRDMFARLSELSITREVLTAAQVDPTVTARQGDEWDLAFALRDEYERYCDEGLSSRDHLHRVDSSQILVEACQAVVDKKVPTTSIPRFCVVDDCQDLTLAGYSLLRACEQAGTRLALIGSDDESVQTFRGAYPEVLSALETVPVAAGGMGAMIAELTEQLDELVRSETSADTYRSAVASRVSQSISSLLVPSDVPVPQRPGKLRSAQAAPDASLRGKLFRSQEEENEDLLWHIRQLVGSKKADYNDIAVIAHDNSIVRAVGHMLEEHDVPVSYSSVTQPLNQIPVIRGLLGLLRLTSIVRSGDFSTQESVRDCAALIRRVLVTPLFSVRTGDVDPRPVRLEKLGTAFAALSSLSSVNVAQQADVSQTDASQTDTAQTDASKVDEPQSGSVQQADRFAPVRSCATSLKLPADRLSADELLVLFLIGDDEVRATLASLLTSLTASRWEVRHSKSGEKVESTQSSENTEGTDDADSPKNAEDTKSTEDTENSENTDSTESDIHDPDTDELVRLIGIVQTCVQHSQSHGELSTSIHAQLWDVWQQTGVADGWQDEAFLPTARGRAVNEWLDAVIRLFTHAQQAPANESSDDFITRIENLQIEADSLASVAPHPNAVTLTTPAGATALHKKYVWILSVQDGSWPNTSPRDALFDGQTLSNVVVRDRLQAAHAVDTSLKGADGRQSDQPDEQELLAMQDRQQRRDLLYSEAKSFLVALTRGYHQTVVSAVNDEKTLPSDFLLAFLPELYGREGLTPFGDGSDDDAGDATPDDSTFVADGVRYSKVGRDESSEQAQLPWLGGLDTSPEGMASAARLMLAGALSRDDASPDSRASHIDDAVNALSLLAKYGVSQADPSSWAFVASAQRQLLRENADAEIGADTNGQGSQAGFDVEAARHAGLLRNLPRNLPGNPLDNNATDHSANHSVDHSRRNVSVPLSPSAVDQLWRCPLCWSLDNRFAGPQPTDASRSIGTVIHAVAQWATETGLDRSVISVEEMLAKLEEHFHEVMADQPQFSDPDQVMKLASGEMMAHKMLERMARYFVESTAPDYGESKSKTGASIDGVGTLEKASAEVPFTAFFGIHDIGEYVRRTPGCEKVSDHELFIVLSWLAGGFPQGTREDIRLRLSARIDRLEQRGSAWDILDWKTGKSKLATFSDLQLVCYQLGLVFSHVAGSHPTIDRSVLFQLRLEDYPAGSRGIPEVLYQPPLFVDGHVNTQFVARPYERKVASLFSETIGQMDTSEIADQSPILLPRILSTLQAASGASEKATKEAAEHANTDLLPWALAMISRVFYAGACLQTGVYPSRHGDDYTRYKEICPQWPVQSQTVYGRLHAKRLAIGEDGRLVAYDDMPVSEASHSSAGNILTDETETDVKEQR